MRKTYATVPTLAGNEPPRRFRGPAQYKGQLYLEYTSGSYYRATDSGLDVLWELVFLGTREELVELLDVNRTNDLRVENLANAARGFLSEQLQPLTHPTFDNAIQLDQKYPTTYTGPVSASYSLPLSKYSTTPGTYITVGDPGDLLPTFRGTVFGSVTLPNAESTAGMKIYYGKVTDTFYPNGNITLDASGFFAIDLSAVETWRKGEWRLELRRADNSVLGGPWPDSGPVYPDVIASLLSVSDAEEVVASTPAPANGKVKFLSSTPGTKKVVLKDRITGELLAATSNVTGNVRSFVVQSGLPGYGTRFVEQSYVYDQALALMAAIANGDNSAHDLVQGLLRLQTLTGIHTGGFRFSGRQSSAEYGDPAYRTGAHALATHSLFAYVLAYPQRAIEVKAKAILAINWLFARTSSAGNTNGLVLGGFGAYIPDGGGGQTFKEEYPLTWASTEHNLDTYFCYKIANKVIGGNTWSNRATALSQVMMSSLWNAEEERLNQGIGTSGPDVADPLDVHSWGAIFLQDIGEYAKAEKTMSEEQLKPFFHEGYAPNGERAQGYATAYDAEGYYGMLPHIWWEGTFSVAYALVKLGQFSRADQVVRAAQPGQNPDGSFPYVNVSIPQFELYPYESVASTAWGILARFGYGIFDTGRA